MPTLDGDMIAMLFAMLHLAASPRPPTWAEPISLPGVGNLHRVDASLYRSEQPTRDGMRKAADSLGIRTIINLRKYHSDRSRVLGTPLELHELDVKTWAIRDEDVVAALRIVRWNGNGPFLVHCQHGADRTGTVIALYRMVFQGWSRKDAVREMVDGGYGFHPVWKNILRYLESVDVAKIKAAVESPPTHP